LACLSSLQSSHARRRAFEPERLDQQTKARHRNTIERSCPHSGFRSAPAEAAKRAYTRISWRQGEFRDFFVGSHAKRFGNDSNVGTPLPLARIRQDFNPPCDDNPPAFRHCDKMFEDNRRQPSEWFFGIADGVVFIGIGIFHQYRAGAIRAQTRLMCRSPFTSTRNRGKPAVLTHRSRSRRTELRQCSHNLPADFVSSVISRTCNRNCIRHRLSWDCKHELLASVTRFDNLNSVIARRSCRGIARGIAITAHFHLPPVFRLGDYPKRTRRLQE